MERFVLDTSVFTNPDVYKQFGPQPVAAIAGFVALAVQARARAQFYMPSSVYDELQRMAELGELAASFEFAVRIRSPRRFALSIPSEVLYEFIEEIRQRIDRGLRLAEEWTKRAGAADTQDVGELITRLRARYRETMRQRLIDSKEDVDVLLLAYELDAVLVSADEGLRRWADRVGIALVEARHFRNILQQLIEHQPPA
jgi:RNA ligase partner protein